MNNAEIVDVIEKHRDKFSERFLNNAIKWNVSSVVKSETLDFGIYRAPEYEPYLDKDQWEHTGVVINVKIEQIEFWINNMKLINFMEGKTSDNIQTKR